MVMNQGLEVIDLAMRIVGAKSLEVYYYNVTIVTCVQDYTIHLWKIPAQHIQILLRVLQIHFKFKKVNRSLIGIKR